MLDDLYSDRHQSRAKHDILKAHLSAFAYKLLNSYGRLTYVDGFAGPWEARDDAKFSDTSFGAAVQILEAAASKCARAQGRQPVRCIFNEADAGAFKRLKDFVERAKVEHPHVEMHAYHGKFEDNVRTIARLAGTDKKLVFVDPRGWKGYPPTALQELADGKSEFILNFMTSFIRRFLAGDHANRLRHLTDLLGPDRAHRVTSAADPMQAIEAEFAGMLKDDLNFKYALRTPIMNPHRNEVHFHLVFASNHPKGVQVIRDSEVRALKKYDSARLSRKSGNQGNLFEPADAPTEDSYIHRHHADLDALEQTMVEIVPYDGRPMDQDHVIALALERLHVGPGDATKTIRNLIKRGLFEGGEDGRGRKILRRATWQ